MADKPPPPNYNFSTTRKHIHSKSNSIYSNSYAVWPVYDVLALAWLQSHHLIINVILVFNNLFGLIFRLASRQTILQASAPSHRQKIVHPMFRQLYIRQCDTQRPCSCRESAIICLAVPTMYQTALFVEPGYLGGQAPIHHTLLSAFRLKKCCLT